MADRSDDPSRSGRQSIVESDDDFESVVSDTEDPGLEEGAAGGWDPRATPRASALKTGKKGDYFDVKILPGRTRLAQSKIDRPTQSEKPAKKTKKATKPKTPVTEQAESFIEQLATSRRKKIAERRRLADELLASSPSLTYTPIIKAADAVKYLPVNQTPSTVPLTQYTSPTATGPLGPSLTPGVSTSAVSRTTAPSIRLTTPEASVPNVTLESDAPSTVKKNLAPLFVDMANGDDSDDDVDDGAAAQEPMTADELQRETQRLTTDRELFEAQKQRYQDRVQDEYANKYSQRLTDDINKAVNDGRQIERQAAQEDIDDLTNDNQRKQNEIDRLKASLAATLGGATGRSIPPIGTAANVSNLGQNVTFAQFPATSPAPSMAFSSAAAMAAAPPVSVVPPSTIAAAAVGVAQPAPAAAATDAGQGVKARDKVYSKYVPEDEELMKRIIAENKQGIPAMPAGMPPVSMITVVQPAAGGPPMTNIATRDPLEELVMRQASFIQRLASGKIMDRMSVSDEAAYLTPQKVQAAFVEHRALAQGAAKHASIIARNADIKALHPVYEKPCPRLGSSEYMGKARRDFIAALGQQTFSGNDDDKDEKRKVPLRHLFEQAHQVIEDNNLSRNGAFHLMRAALCGPALKYLNSQYLGGFTFESYWATMQSMFGRQIDPSKLIHDIDRVRNTAPAPGRLADSIAELSNLHEQNNYMLDGVEKVKAVSAALHRDIMYMVNLFYPFAYPEVERMEKDALSRHIAERASLEEQGLPLTMLQSTYHASGTLTTIAVNMCRKLPVVGNASSKKHYPVHAVDQDNGDNASGISKSSKNSKRDRSTKSKSVNVAAASNGNVSLESAIAAVLDAREGRGGYNANRSGAQRQQQQQGPRQDARGQGGQPARGGGVYNRDKPGNSNTRNFRQWVKAPRPELLLAGVLRGGRSRINEVEMGSSDRQAGTLSPSARSKPRWSFLALFASPVLSPITSGVRATCTRCRPGPTCARSAPGSTRSPVPPSVRRRGRSREAELVMLGPEIT